jgi:hypothetical protein
MKHWQHQFQREKKGNRLYLPAECPTAGLLLRLKEKEEMVPGHRRAIEEAASVDTISS